MLSLVVVTMKSSLEVCPHCRRDFRVRVSDDIGFYFYWVDNYYLFDVVLVVLEGSGCFMRALYREVYACMHAH